MCEVMFYANLTFESDKMQGIGYVSDGYSLRAGALWLKDRAPIRTIWTLIVGYAYF